MNDHLTVGYLAKRAGVTPNTVRYYEQVGLLPSARRGANGYRYFRRGDLNRLRFIQRAKGLGLSLDEIRELVMIAEDGRCARTRAGLRKTLDDKIAACSRHIEALVVFRNQLEAAARQLDVTESELDAPCCPSCAEFAPTCGCIPGLPDEHR